MLASLPPKASLIDLSITTISISDKRHWNFLCSKHWQFHTKRTSSTCESEQLLIGTICAKADEQVVRAPWAKLSVTIIVVDLWRVLPFSSHVLQQNRAKHLDRCTFIRERCGWKMRCRHVLCVDRCMCRPVWKPINASACLLPASAPLPPWL